MQRYPKGYIKVTNYNHKENNKKTYAKIKTIGSTKLNLSNWQDSPQNWSIFSKHG